MNEIYKTNKVVRNSELIRRVVVPYGDINREDDGYVFL